MRVSVKILTLATQLILKSKTVCTFAHLQAHTDTITLHNAHNGKGYILYMTQNNTATRVYCMHKSTIRYHCTKNTQQRSTLIKQNQHSQI